ncbi:MAG: hypothetical protein QM776_17290 [Rhodocyclaceae bacterium]
MLMNPARLIIAERFDIAMQALTRVGGVVTSTGTITTKTTQTVTG